MRNLNTFNVFTMNQNKKDEHHEPGADKWVPHVCGTPFSHLFFCNFCRKLAWRAHAAIYHLIPHTLCEQNES